MAYSQQQPQYRRPPQPYSNLPSHPNTQNRYNQNQLGAHNQPQEQGASYAGYDGDGFWEDYGYNEESAGPYAQREQYQADRAPNQGQYTAGAQQARHYPQEQTRQYAPQGGPRGNSNGMHRGPPNGQMPPGPRRSPPYNYGQDQRFPPNGNYNPQPQQHGSQQKTASGHRQDRDPMAHSRSPTSLNFDNPFPVFPGSKGTSRIDEKAGVDGMENLNLNGQPSHDGHYTPTAASRMGKNTHGPGQYYDIHNVPPPGHPQGQFRRPSMDDPASRGPPRRAMTLPQNSGYLPNNGDSNHYSDQYAVTANNGRGFGPPGARDPVPQRSFTATGTRSYPHNMPPPQRSFTSVGTRPEPQQRQPSEQQASQHPVRHEQHQSQASSHHQPGQGNVTSPIQQPLNTPRLRESQLDAYMPDFDASSTESPLMVDPIGLPLDNAPGLQRPPTRTGTGTPGSRAPEVYEDPQGPLRSRSQPDLRDHASQNQVYRSGPDAPPMPRGPSPMNGAAYSQQSSSMYANDGYGHPMQQQPQYDLQQRSQYGGHPPPQGPNARQFHRPGAPMGPQVARAETAPAGWPDQRAGPGHGMNSRSPVVRTGHVAGSSSVQAGQPEQPYNPDALPSHPAPVRPGLTQGGQDVRAARPPPVRQYDGGAQQQRAPATSSGTSDQQKRQSAPVTFEEISRLRQAVANKPSDYKTQLQLAKKLIEAAHVLVDDAGRTDTKARNKSRENYIFEAHKMIKKLCSNQYPEAMFFLADCYGTGQIGLAVDQKEAFQLYQQAAKLGHAPSAYRTAVCCEMGSDAGGGTRRDPLKAVQWYRRAATLGDVPAMYKLGMILLKGLLGQQASLGEAVIWLERAAERADEENPHALHELAALYETAPNGGKIIRDEAYAFQLYEKAARFGYRLSQCRLGQAYEYGHFGCQIDNRSSIHWYSKAAAQEDHEAELALSGWYLTGSAGILDQSDTEAYLWARKAAKAELPKAEFAMGYYSEIGIGCPRSLDDAKRWYGRAAAHHYPKAQERLEELKRGGAKAQRGRERLSRSDKNKHEECVLM